MSSPTTERVHLDLQLPEIWTITDLSDEAQAATEAELAAMLADDVDDPEVVAAASMEEFRERIGGGSTPVLIASLRQELDDGALLAASLIVTKNDLTGSLEPWTEAYGDAAVDVEVLGAPALRIEERSNVNAGELFDGPVQIVTWRYVVPFDARSVLMFAFSTPNHELDELLLEHVEMIMSGVSVSLSDHASGENPPNTDSPASN